MRGVPVAVEIERACIFQDTVQLYAARAHEVDIGLCRCVPVLERAFFLCFSPEYFVIAVRVERRVDINQIDTGIGEFRKLFEVVAAIDYAGVYQSRWPSARFGFTGIGF